MADTKSHELIEMTETYGDYHPLPIVVSRGEGVWIWAPEGIIKKEELDWALERIGKVLGK